jgi:hypothetical protein
MQLGNTQRMNTRRFMMFGLVALGLLALGVAIGLGLARPTSLAIRQAEVADRGAEVMPFDLERTTHIFEKLDDGGIQSVRADDPGDAAQIELIQAHLSEEAEKFRRGDFSDPAAIHGHTMPGLDTLRASAGNIAVAYTPLSDGGHIRYTTTDPTLVNGLHRWFDAQLMDHGAHASENP